MNLSSKSFFIPMVFLFITIAAYGVLLPSLGFYGDDWSYIYYHKLLGFQGPGMFAGYDRPFSAFFYNLAIEVLGLAPLPYHIFLLILRWLSAVLLWLLLSRLWSNHERPVFWIAVLFLLYPGFSQQPISVQYILHFSGLNLTLLSILLMLLSLEPSRWRWAYVLFAALCSANLFAIEYFVGLEVLRPLVIWMALGNRNWTPWKRLWKSFLFWLPYFFVVVGFLVWRVFFFQFPTYQPTLLAKIVDNPADGFLYMLKVVLQDIKTVFYDAWRQSIRFPSMLPNRIMYGLSLLITFVALLGAQKQKTQQPHVENQDRLRLRAEWAIQPLILGGFALLSAGWPFWITGIDIEMGFPWDRPTLPFMLGVSLLLVGFIELFIRSQYRAVPYFVLTLLAVGFHISNAEVYQAEWRRTTDFFWQLTWRIPDLEEGTVLASDNIPLYRVGDSALSAPLNWTYAPNLQGPDLAYKVFDLNIRLGTEYTGISGLEEGLPIRHDYRFTSFESTTSSLLVFYYPEDGCLQIIEAEDQNLPFLPEKVVRLAPLSKPDLILTGKKPAQPPAFMGPEPEHGWCYTFQTAELAAQRSDWKQVILLAETAQVEGFEPQDPSELLVFMEGYARMSDPETALRLTSLAASNDRLLPAVCQTWKEILITTEYDQNDIQLVQQSLREIGCDLE